MPRMDGLDREAHFPKKFASMKCQRVRNFC